MALSQAIKFACDIQELNHANIGEAIKEVLTRYPDAEVGDTIKFYDGSEAILQFKPGEGYMFQIKD